MSGQRCIFDNFASDHEFVILTPLLDNKNRQLRYPTVFTKKTSR